MLYEERIRRMRVVLAHLDLAPGAAWLGWEIPEGASAGIHPAGGRPRRTGTDPGHRKCVGAPRPEGAH